VPKMKIKEGIKRAYDRIIENRDRREDCAGF